MKKIFLALTAFFSTTIASSQTDSIKPNEEHEHIHPLFEIGFSTAAVYLVAEKETTVGFHAHFTTNISHRLPFIAGIAYEYIVDEHQHHSLGLVFGWNPFHEFVFSVSPGLTTNSGNFVFAAHAEIS